MRTAARLCVTAITAIGAFASTGLLAQSAPAPAIAAAAPASASATKQPAGPAPRLPGGKPDLSGHWANPYTPNMAAKGTVLDPATRKPLNLAGTEIAGAKPAAMEGGGKRTLDLPYTPWGLERWKSYDPVNDGDYAGSCLPFGMSRNINSPHGLQIVQNDAAIALLFEQNTWFHWIPTNGAKWPVDRPFHDGGISAGHFAPFVGIQ